MPSPRSCATCGRAYSPGPASPPASAFVSHVWVFSEEYTHTDYVYSNNHNDVTCNSKHDPRSRLCTRSARPTRATGRGDGARRTGEFAVPFASCSTGRDAYALASRALSAGLSVGSLVSVYTLDRTLTRLEHLLLRIRIRQIRMLCTEEVCTSREPWRERNTVTVSHCPVIVSIVILC
jgi:hypothetical protein